MLLNKLKRKPFCNNFHIILVSIILLMLSLKYYFIFIFLALYLIFIFKRFKFILISSLIFISIIFLECIFINNIKEPKEEITLKIEDVDDNGYIAKNFLYKIKITEKNTNYIPGDIVKFELKYDEIKEKSYENQFDYKEYLKSNKILYKAYSNNSTKIRSGFSLNLLKYRYMNYLKDKLDENTFMYIKAIVFAENDISSDLKEGYSILGISHILAISGLHIMLIFNFLSFILNKLFRIYQKKIPLLLIFIYVASIGFKESALRALLFLLIGALNEKGEAKYTKLDILSISFIIMILKWPFIFNNLGFILSFLVSFILIFSNEIIKTKYKLLNLYLTYLIIYFMTLPFISSFNNQISILAILLSPILSLIIGFVIIPVSFFVTIFPISDIIFKYLFLFINEYILNMKNYNFHINIPTFNIYMKIIYYVFIFLFIRSIIINKHKIYYFSFFLFTLVSLIAFNLIHPYTKITFIDVGQGDSCLIELSYGKGNILIDSYNSIDFLKSEGISTIDYLVLSHGDSDHAEEAIEVINYFKIKNIILNQGEFNDIENNILTTAKENNIDCNNKIDKFLISNYDFIFLNTKIYNNENDNSNVIYVNIDGIDLLFMGDAEKEKEKDIIEKYNFDKIDILKVGHHGSNTSSTIEFINRINPNDSIISVGKNNRYGHPDKEALNNLKNSNVYRTDIGGNITLKIFKNKYKIEAFNKKISYI